MDHRLPVAVEMGAAPWQRPLSFAVDSTALPPTAPDVAIVGGRLYRRTAAYHLAKIRDPCGFI